MGKGRVGKGRMPGGHGHWAGGYARGWKVCHVARWQGGGFACAKLLGCSLHLERGDDGAVHRREQHRRHVCEACRRDFHFPLCVAVGRVEACRDEEQLGAKRAQDREQDEVERRKVVRVAQAVVGPWDVDVRTLAAVFAHFI